MSQCIQSFQYRAVFLAGIAAVGVLLSGCVDRTGQANSATIKASPSTCIKGEPMTQTTLTNDALFWFEPASWPGYFSH